MKSRGTIHVRCLVVLETMWGRAGKAPGLFHINPQNHSGRRLYWLLSHSDFFVTNACRNQVNNAREHDKPDPVWLATNLQRCKYDLLLVCGKVAQATYARCGYVPNCRVLQIPHPAARTWTKATLEETRRLIEEGAH